jgi:hypothetical protein
MWPILVAPNRRRDKQVLFLIVSFFGNHQDFVQSSGSVATRQSWEAAGSHRRQQVIVEVRKGAIFSGDEYIAKTRQGGGKNLKRRDARARQAHEAPLYLWGNGTAWNAKESWRF